VGGGSCSRGRGGSGTRSANPSGTSFPDDCKIPGAARHSRKKTKKLSAKVDITKLPSRPCVLPVNKILFARDTLAAVARVRASMKEPRQVELDVSTHGELQATASGLGSEYVEDYAPMARSLFGCLLF
jgi:hypothetical protein